MQCSVLTYHSKKINGELQRHGSRTKQLQILGTELFKKKNEVRSTYFVVRSTKYEVHKLLKKDYMSLKRVFELIKQLKKYFLMLLIYVFNIIYSTLKPKLQNKQNCRDSSPEFIKTCTTYYVLQTTYFKLRTSRTMNL